MEQAMVTPERIVVYDISRPPYGVHRLLYGFPLAHHATWGIPVGPIMSGGFRPLMMLVAVGEMLLRSGFFFAIIHIHRD